MIIRLQYSGIKWTLFFIRAGEPADSDAPVIDAHPALILWPALGAAVQLPLLLLLLLCRAVCRRQPSRCMRCCSSASCAACMVSAASASHTLAPADLYVENPVPDGIEWGSWEMSLHSFRYANGLKGTDVEGVGIKGVGCILRVCYRYATQVCEK